MLTRNILETYLNIMHRQSPDEWGLVNSESTDFWIIKYMYSRPPFDFYIEYNDDMLYIQYQTNELRVKPTCWLPLYQMLLRLNEEVSLVKFGLSAFNNISLMGELPASVFSLDAFQNLLRLMVHYLEQLYWELDIIATSPSLAPFLTGSQAYFHLSEQEMDSLVQRIDVEV